MDPHPGERAGQVTDWVAQSGVLHRGDKRLWLLGELQGRRAGEARLLVKRAWVLACQQSEQRELCTGKLPPCHTASRANTAAPPTHSTPQLGVGPGPDRSWERHRGGLGSGVWPEWGGRGRSQHCSTTGDSMLRPASQPREHSSPTHPTPQPGAGSGADRAWETTEAPQVSGNSTRSCSHNALTASLTNTPAAASPCHRLALNHVQPQQRSK